MLWMWMCVDAGDLNAGRELPELRRRLTGEVPVSGPRTPLSQSRAGTQLSAEARPITGRQEAALLLITLHHQHRGDHRTIYTLHTTWWWGNYDRYDQRLIFYLNIYYLNIYLLSQISYPHGRHLDSYHIHDVESFLIVFMYFCSHYTKYFRPRERASSFMSTYNESTLRGIITKWTFGQYFRFGSFIYLCFMYSPNMGAQIGSLIRFVVANMTLMISYFLPFARQRYLVCF